jgi:hypothetical protein
MEDQVPPTAVRYRMSKLNLGFFIYLEEKPKFTSENVIIRGSVCCKILFWHWIHYLKFQLRIGPDGTYLVRPSRKGGYSSICTLNVQFGGRVYHVLVQRRDDGNVGLGTEKEGEEVIV